MRQTRPLLLPFLLAWMAQIHLAYSSEPSAPPLSPAVVERLKATSDLASQVENAIQRGQAFLLSQQQPDGTWRSKTYGLLKDGTSLTPLVLWALPDHALTRQAKERGLTVINNWIDHNADPIQLATKPQYPVYTAGLTLQALHRTSFDKAGQEVLFWRRLLLAHQLTAENGWSADDVRFGGWGYSHEPPIKPDGDQGLSPLDEPNLSATLFAMEGLSSTRLDPIALAGLQEQVLRFVTHCQNYHEGADVADQKCDDGGFYFLIGDDVRNKPGIAGTDSAGRTRYISYGSATADGLRLLQLCGVDPRHPRRVAARDWLLQHLNAGQNSGDYPPARQHLQPALDFYYAASLSCALQHESEEVTSPVGANWATTIVETLIKRQDIDGSWKNPAVDVREDDPLIATSFALRALQNCRTQMQKVRSDAH